MWNIWKDKEQPCKQIEKLQLINQSLRENEKSANIRDCIRFGCLAASVSTTNKAPIKADVIWIVETFIKKNITRTTM